MFIATAIYITRDTRIQHRADRFTPSYNQAMRGQWSRFRQAHPEINCAPPIPRSGSIVRTLLDGAAGIRGRRFPWPRSWGKDIESALLAEFNEDEAYAAQELRNAQARKAKEVASRKDASISVTFIDCRVA
jgi:hypothetical protein